MSSAPTEVPAGEQNREAIQAYRTTARWVISSFGAVAAALIAGVVPLSSLTSTTGVRLAFALLSLLVAGSAIVFVMRSAVSLLEPVRGTYHDFASDKFKLLAEHLARDPSPLRLRATSAAELASKYTAALKAELDSYTLYRKVWLLGAPVPPDSSPAAPAPVPPDSSPAAPAPAAGRTPRTLNDLYVDAREQREQLEPIVIAITSLGLVLNAKAEFAETMRRIYGGAFAVALATVAFAILANQPAKASPEPKPKVAVTVNERQTCAGLYLTLAELAHRSPQIAANWPAAKLGKQEQLCGLADEKKLKAFLSALEHH